MSQKRYVDMHKMARKKDTRQNTIRRGDAFVFHEPAYEIPIVFKVVEIDGQKLYAVGAYHWTWVES